MASGFDACLRQRKVTASLSKGSIRAPNLATRRVSGNQISYTGTRPDTQNEIMRDSTPVVAAMTVKALGHTGDDAVRVRGTCLKADCDPTPTAWNERRT